MHQSGRCLLGTRVVTISAANMQPRSQLPDLSPVHFCNQPDAEQRTSQLYWQRGGTVGSYKWNAEWTFAW